MAATDLVPSQMGLLGINNEDWTNLTTPTVSTVIEPTRQLGSLVCSMLLDKLANPEEPPHQNVLDCQVRWGGTTA